MFGQDFALDGLSPRALENFLDDIRRQPNWRFEADRAASYYDGNQLDQDTLDALRAKGMGPLIDNLIKPVVDSVLGLEAKTRTDCRVEADSDDDEDLAEALSARLMECGRETHANRAISDAYAGQVKAGMGWVEVSRNSNPFAYRYRVGFVHRREIFWDWLAREPDLSDARYLVRKRWFDVDIVKGYFPQHARLIDAVTSGWQDWTRILTQYDSFARPYEIERDSTLDEIEWRDIIRRRVAVFETWYRVYRRGPIIRKPDGTAVVFNSKDPAHIVAVASGRANIQMAVYPTMRCAWWIGPHRVMDFGHPENDFPYVPFWGYREDLTGIPYGLVRSMMSPQDEINARRAKLMWLLSAKRVTMDSDALDTKHNTFQDVAREVNRPDAMIITNPEARRSGSSILVENDMQMAQQQFQILQEQKQSITQVGGVYNAFMGQDSSASSGVAISGLVEQGTMTLAELNDNYRFGRQKVFHKLMRLELEDLQRQKNIAVRTGDQGSRRTIVLNLPMMDESGTPQMQNDIRAIEPRIALSDTPSTPSYRQQQLTMLMEITKSMPAQLQAFIVPFVMDSTDLPKRHEISALLRKQLGIAPPQQPRTPEEAQALQQQQQAQAQAQALQQKQIELAIQKAEEEIRLLGAKADHQEGLATRGKEIDRLQSIISELKAALADRSAHLAENKRQFDTKTQLDAEKFDATHAARQQQLAAAAGANQSGPGMHLSSGGGEPTSGIGQQDENANQNALTGAHQPQGLPADPMPAGQ